MCRFKDAYSVAVDILYKMALDKHIDMDLFLLFLQSGAYLEYANKFLPKSQNDYVTDSLHLLIIKPSDR